MAIYALDDREPVLGQDTYVHPDAVVIGAVTLGDGVSVWPGAVLRGDYGTITVGARTNIQDGTVIHCTVFEPTVIGERCVVGHNAHIEGATIGDDCLIASGSVVLNGSTVGDGAIVGAGAVVPFKFDVPPRRMALGVPARLRDGYEVPQGHTELNCEMYFQNAQHYRTALKRLGLTTTHDGGNRVTAPPKPLAELIDPGWAQALAPVEPLITEMGRFLRTEIAEGRRYLPAGQHVLRAFTRPFEDVRVLIVGQDPYPTPGHAVGLSFSVAPDVRPIPRSLTNIYTEYCADLGYPTPTTGDLTPWADNGVLLLNRVLTVAPGEPASHRGKGWETVTECAIKALAARDEPLVAILWGRDAAGLEKWLPDVPTIVSAHPSPLSASRGFFGSRPFSRANEELLDLGAEPVDWRLP